MLLVSLYQQYRGLPALQQVLAGLAPAATGLIFGMGLRLAARLERSSWCIALAVATFVAIGLLHWPLLPLLLVMVPLAVTLAWHLQKEPT
jgi:chromate transporter